MQSLVTWKDSANRKPLLLTGVRQCGKTYVCKQFGELYFEDVAYYYFEGNNGLASVFEYDFDVDRILDELGNVIRQKPIIPGKTLVIFDEIQACPRAITSLKYFCENKRELHIICAGSLLGVSIKRDGISFPVGKIERLHMYPLSFSEFLRADGGQAIYDGVQKYPLRRELPELYTQNLIKKLQYYYIVGGMPEAVQEWVENHNFEAVDKIQGNILEDYAGDFAKYAPVSDVPKLGWIWESIPKQLAKENNKFVFS
ncbi:MAG: AAA family ATPase, partial [Lachnospiraceae bacterium]|nr:AAA family ATPase [Lachnospiraceae bacterium]